MGPTKWPDDPPGTTGVGVAWLQVKGDKVTQVKVVGQPLISWLEKVMLSSERYVVCSDLSSCRNDRIIN